MKRVYLDNCCYNRPYDDQTQVRISLEAQAKMEIQRMIKNHQLELVTSYMTEYENAQNPNVSNRTNISEFQKEYATAYVAGSTDEKVRQIANKIEETGIKHKDACHAACAILAGCEYLLTTDDRLMKYQDHRIKIMNPTQFILEEEDEK